MSDLSIFQVTVTSCNAEGTTDTNARYVRAEDFDQAIRKFLDTLSVQEGYFITDAHAEWFPEMEDIIE